MFAIRVLKGLEYGKELYELEGKLYGRKSCPYETREQLSELSCKSSV